MRKNIVFFITLFVLISIVLVISGCTLIFGAQCNEKDPSSTHTFWSVNIGGGFFSEAYCEIGTADPVEGQYVRVYPEYKYRNEPYIQKVVDEFDEMYPTMATKFGSPVLGPNNNGKVTIVVLDIIDGYDPIWSPSYVGGYFFSLDYLTEASLHEQYPNDHSNEQAVIFIDVYPQDVTQDDVYSTVAHEFQHMINFSQNVLNGGTVTPTVEDILAEDTPTWINEGFSMGAEQVWAKEIKNITTGTEWPVYSRVQYFNNSSYFVEGNPLIKWISNESGYDVLSNYSTSFLFFQYMRIQSSSDSGIFKTMMDSTDDSIGQIDTVLSSIPTASNFSELYENWAVANMINMTSGKYGYQNSEGLKDVQAFANADSKSWGFYPGSFIYRKACNTVSGLSSYMKALKFDDSGTVTPCGSSCSVGSNEYIVIYNSDTNPDGSAITFTVPAGTAVGGTTKDYNPNQLFMIDWNINKPLSVFEFPKFPDRRDKNN